MAANLSFLACLQGLQRFGSFFNPLSWKNACSPEVQMKCSLQSTHLMLRSGCSESEVVSTSSISSRSDMIHSPGVDPNRDLTLGGPLGSGLPFVQRGAAILLASIGVSVGCPRTGGADGESYNYGEFVSRVKPAYSGNWSNDPKSLRSVANYESAGHRFRGSRTRDSLGAKTNFKRASRTVLRARQRWNLADRQLRPDCRHGSGIINGVCPFRNCRSDYCRPGRSVG